MAVMRVTADNRTLTTLVANSIVQGAGPRPGSVRVAKAIYSRFPFTIYPKDNNNNNNSLYLYSAFSKRVMLKSADQRQGLQSSVGVGKFK